MPVEKNLEIGSCCISQIVTQYSYNQDNLGNKSKLTELSVPNATVSFTVCMLLHKNPGKEGCSLAREELGSSTKREQSVSREACHIAFSTL